MLGKNILSIIGLLFVGRTLAQQGNALPECEDEVVLRRDEVFEHTESYCIDKGSKKIYNVNDKLSPLSEGVHVFMNGGDVGISEINLTGGTSNPIESGKEGNLSMYLCDEENVCNQTEGYIKVTYGTKDIESEDYYEIKSDSSKKAEKVTDKCDGNNRIGLQSSTYGVCLSVEGKSVEFAGESGEEENYLLDGTIASGSIFKSVAEGKSGIVLTRDVSKIYFNNIYTDEEFCKYEDKKIIKRKEQFVDGTILNTLYECADGVCDISKVPENVDDGDYLVDGIIYNRSGVKIEQLTESGIFAFKKSDPTDITYSNLLSSDDIGKLTSNDLGSVYLYDCVNGVCIRTPGFIKYGSTAALAECTNEKKCETLESVDCKEGTANGSINLTGTEMKLCVSESLSESTYNSIGTTMYETNSDKNIIGAKQTGNFLSGSKLIVCEDGECTSPDSAAGYYLNSNYEEITAGKKLISCTDANNCELIEPKNGYYINKDSTNSKRAILCDKNGCSETGDLTKENCNSDANKLVYSNGALKYCDDNNVKNIPGDSSTVNLYEVNGVKKSDINYPTDFIANPSTTEKMVIQVDQYSVTPYVDENNSFCIEDDVKKAKCEDGNTGFKCVDATESCTTFTVGACDLKDINENCNGYYVNASNELISCNGEECGEAINKIGYFKNGKAKTYIKCTTNGEKQQSITCEAITPESNCVNVGDLIKDESDNVKLCVDNIKENAITIFTNEDSKKYFIKASGLNSKDSIVSSQKHYIVNVAENEVLTETVTDYKKYKYIKSTGTPAILVKGKENGIKDPESELVEFTKSKENDNTYEKEDISQ